MPIESKIKYIQLTEEPQIIKKRIDMKRKLSLRINGEQDPGGKQTKEGREGMWDADCSSVG